MAKIKDKAVILSQTDQKTSSQIFCIYSVWISVRLSWTTDPLGQGPSVMSTIQWSSELPVGVQSLGGELLRSLELLATHYGRRKHKIHWAYSPKITLNIRQASTKFKFYSYHIKRNFKKVQVISGMHFPLSLHWKGIEPGTK